MSGGSDNQTMTVQNPPWLDTASQNLLGQAGNVYSGAQPNPSQLGAWAGADAWGQMAPGALGQAYNVESQNANYQMNPSWLGPLAGLLGTGSSWLNWGSGLGGTVGGPIGSNGARQTPAALAQTATIDPSQLQQMDPRSILDYNIADYMNPYTGQVVDSTMSDIERARQVAGRNDAAQAAGAGAFGGSRQAVQSALTNSEYDRNSAAAAAQLRDAAFNSGMGLAQGDLANATAADQFNAQQAYQTALANAGFSNAGSQFNAGQQNQLTQTQLQTDAQRAAASMAAGASLNSARLNAQVGMANARNNTLSTLISGALGLGNLGIGGDLNAATLRGNSASQLANFGQGGLGAQGAAGDAMYGLPFDNLGWLSGIIGNVPHGQTSSQPIYHNRGAGALGGAATGASAGSAFGPWGTAIGALGGGLMGYFGS